MCWSYVSFASTQWNIHFNTLRQRQNGRRFADDTFKRIFLNENVRISIKISPKFVPKGSINNNPALGQIMAWRRSGDKPLSEPMMVSLLTHICVTRPQWVNGVIYRAIQFIHLLIWEILKLCDCMTLQWCHMSVMASQNTGNLTICSIAYWGKQQRKRGSSALLAFCEGNHKGPLMGKVFPWHNINMNFKTLELLWDYVKTLLILMMSFCLQWLPVYKIIYIPRNYKKPCFCSLQATSITWADVDPDLCCHMASLGHNELLVASLTCPIESKS